MTTTTTSAHPVRTLREQVTALEAAITLCVASPKTRPVHRLRTMTRRIEGQLALLALLHGVTDHGKPARRALRRLKRFRRAAGVVRDIDVQLDLIEAVTPEDSPRPLREDSNKLRASLEMDREELAEELVRQLRRGQTELTLALEEILGRLEPVENLSLSATELASLTQQWFVDNTPPEPEGGAQDPDHLHAIRKVAKLARYIAENAPKAAKRPRQLAESFERLQQSGGDWHDWLVLAELARERLGGSSEFTKTIHERSLAALGNYNRNLREIA